MGRPTSEAKKITIEFQATSKMVAYLDELKKKERFGENRQEVVKGLIWAGISKLILEKQLKEK